MPITSVQNILLCLAETTPYGQMQAGMHVKSLSLGCSHILIMSLRCVLEHSGRSRGRVAVLRGQEELFWLGVPPPSLKSLVPSLDDASKSFAFIPLYDSAPPRLFLSFFSRFPACCFFSKFFCLSNLITHFFCLSFSLYLMQMEF